MRDIEGTIAGTPDAGNSFGKLIVGTSKGSLCMLRASHARNAVL